MPRSLEEVQSDIRALLFTTPKQRAALGLPQSSKEALRDMCQIILDHLKERGHVFFANGQGYIMTENLVPIVVSHDGVGLSYLLNKDYLITPGLKERKDIGLHIGTICEKEGDRVEFRVGSYYDSDTNTVYLAERLGYMLKISKNKILRVENGTDHQYFLFHENYEPWEVGDLDRVPGGLFPFETEESHAEPSLFDELFFKGMILKESVLTLFEWKLLVKVYIVTLLMRGVIHERLMFLLLGATGSGKTFFTRVIGKMLIGSNFDVVGLDEDLKELENKLVNNVYVALDDPGTIDAKALSLIKRATSGGKMQRRNLYTTAGQVELPYIADLAMTCVSQPFYNLEETNRQLANTLGKREAGNRSERDLLKEIQAQRNMFLWEMTGTIINVLEAIDEAKGYQGTTPLRLAGFALLFIKILMHEAASPEEGELLAREILRKWKLMQETSIFQGDDLAEALHSLTRSSKFVPGKRYTSSDLLGLLRDHYNGRPYWAESALRLGKKLKVSEGSYTNVFGLVISENRRTHGNLYSFTPPWDLTSEET